jgi:hypothetical protein
MISLGSERAAACCISQATDGRLRVYWWHSFCLFAPITCSTLPWLFCRDRVLPIALFWKARYIRYLLHHSSYLPLFDTLHFRYCSLSFYYGTCIRYCSATLYQVPCGIFTETYDGMLQHLQVLSTTLMLLCISRKFCLSLRAILPMFWTTNGGSIWCRRVGGRRVLFYVQRRLCVTSVDRPVSSIDASRTYITWKCLTSKLMLLWYGHHYIYVFHGESPVRSVGDCSVGRVLRYLACITTCNYLWACLLFWNAG